jgi:predicted lipoprotein with Yx(FWY)xxD motif
MHRTLPAVFITAAALTTTTACGVLSAGSPGAAPSGSVSFPPSAPSSASAAASAGALSAAPATASLRAESTGAGTVLATGTGLSLYWYTGDRKSSGTSSCTGSCAVTWPPLIAPVQVPAGVKLAGPVGSITRLDGTQQVTIDGYPIYRYNGDTRPGDVVGNGIAGLWHVVNVNGPQAVRVQGTGHGRLLLVEHTAAGWVLASPHGLTVYYYTADHPGSGLSACTGGCSRTWPPVLAPDRIPAGLMLAGPLGFIIRPDGMRQLTINGYPVYRYDGDKAPGQARGNGIAGAWHVIHVTPPGT